LSAYRENPAVTSCNRLESNEVVRTTNTVLALFHPAGNMQADALMASLPWRIDARYVPGMSAASRDCSLHPAQAELVPAAVAVRDPGQSRGALSVRAHG